MPKVKLTKTELKKQRDALKQFMRFLPTLQLKKQQLQMEIRSCQVRLDRNEQEDHELKSQLSFWVALFGPEENIEKFTGLVTLEGIDCDMNNIAGVNVPVFKEAHFKTEEYDLFSEEAWIDDAVRMIEKLIELQAEHDIIQEQYKRLAHELRVTTQRVNLFEKVKIPECRENIRLIQIYLSDRDIAAVGRSKIAKRKMQEPSAA